MKTDAIKPKVIALVAVAFTVTASAANAATKVAAAGGCPLCR